MHQRSADLSTPLLGDEGRPSSSFGSSSIDDERTTAVRTRRPRRDCDLTPKEKVRYLAIYLIVSFFLVYNGALGEDTDYLGLGWTLLSIFSFMFLVFLLPKRERNRPMGSCCHPGTNMSSINATIESSANDEEMQQTPAHVLRKVACDTCGNVCSRIKVLIFLISISVLWAALFLSVVYGITCILNPSGETRYMLRHGLKQFFPLDD